MLFLSGNWKRPFALSLIFCYLLLLGYYHAKQDLSVTSPEILVPTRPVQATRQSSPKRTYVAEPEPVAVQRPEKPPGIPSGTLPTLASPDLNGAARFEYYKMLAQAHGLPITGLTVVGLRGLSPDGRRHDSSENATKYDDTFVILDPYREIAMELLGSTHAGQLTSTLSPGGVAQIQPGIYQADPCGEFAGMPCWLVTTESGSESIPCLRDANGNGYIDPVERKNLLLATEILFHNGRYQDYGSSIGCQVLPPDLMQRFIEEIGVSNAFTYLLIDANQVIR